MNPENFGFVGRSGEVERDRGTRSYLHLLHTDNRNRKALGWKRSKWLE